METIKMEHSQPKTIYLYLFFFLCCVLISEPCHSLDVSHARLTLAETFRASQAGSPVVNNQGVAMVTLNAQAQFELGSVDVIGEEDSIATYVTVMCCLGDETQVNVTITQSYGEMRERYDVTDGAEIIQGLVLFSNPLQISVECSGNVSVQLDNATFKDSTDELLADIASAYNITMPLIKLAPENSDVATPGSDVDDGNDDATISSASTSTTGGDGSLLPSHEDAAPGMQMDDQSDSMPTYIMLNFQSKPALHCLPYLLENVNFTLEELMALSRANINVSFDTGFLLNGSLVRICALTFINIIASVMYGLLKPNRTLERRMAMPMGVFLLLVFVHLCIDLQAEADYHVCYVFVWSPLSRAGAEIAWYTTVLIWICFPTCFLYFNLIIWEGLLFRRKGVKHSELDKEELDIGKEKLPVPSETDNSDNVKSKEADMFVIAEQPSESHDWSRVPESVLDLSEVICCLIGLSISTHEVAVQIFPMCGFYLHLSLVFAFLCYHYQTNQYKRVS